MSSVAQPQSSESADPRLDRSLPMDVVQRIDEVCEEFERRQQSPAVATGSTSEIESLLAGWSGLSRRVLLRELLALEVEYRRRDGETVSAEELRARYPDDADIVDLVLAETSASADGAAQPLRDHPRYRILERIGAGGMGAVYRAEHSVLGRNVAVKVIRPELLQKPAAQERFLQEARVAASLNHPNIVTVHDAEILGAGPFLVMEYVDGTDLARIVRDRGPLPVTEACDAIRQAALGLQAAFEAGLVHRDLSPRNLMRTRDGTIKLLDFGLALLFSAQARADAASEIGGSLEYMAPEQASIPARSDVRSDLYSLGCVLWYLLTATPPRRVRSLDQLRDERVVVQRPSLAMTRPDAPAGLAVVLDRLLARKPEDRYQTPEELAEALEPFCETDAARDVDDATDARSERRASRRWKRAGVAAAATALVLLLGVGAWELWGRHSSHETPTEATMSRMFREAHHLLGQRKERQARLAITRLEAILAADPRNGHAWAALATAWNLFGDYGWELPANSFPKGKRAAERALEIDSDLAEAHLALAFAFHGYDCDWDRADSEYREALDLDPELASAHHWYAWFLVQRGKSEQAREHIEQARQLAPDDVVIVNNVGKILYFSGDFEGAAGMHRYALELNPDFRKAHLDLAYTLIELDKVDAALEELDEAGGISEMDLDVATARAYAMARSGQAEAARAELATLEPNAATQGYSLEMAQINATLGNTEAAFEWLESAMKLRSPGRAGLAVDPRLKPLQNDPRFHKLLQRLKLEPERT